VGGSGGVNPNPVAVGGASSCGEGGAAGADLCSIPPSVCQEDAMTLVYYTDPRCVNETCQTTAMTLLCSRGCVDGACVQNFTVK
jgi:hypothetical protein